MNRYSALLGTAILLIIAFILIALSHSRSSAVKPASEGLSASANSPAPLTGASNSSGDGNKGADVGTRGIPRDILIDRRRAPEAPAFADGTWLNSDPLTIKSLRGRVVLVDFWTFGCYNCINTLPALKHFDARYRDHGLTIIGVETPEFDSEKQLETLRQQVQKRGIKYPVLTDYNADTWRAYNIEAWPTVVILDKEGRVRWTHIGEGLYEEQERVIRQLLAEK